MSRRIILLPEELEQILKRLKDIEDLIKSSQKTPTDPILCPEEVLKVLKISRRCLQGWRDQGLIRFSVVGGKFFYRLSAINEMLDRHVVKMEDSAGR